MRSKLFALSLLAALATGSAAWAAPPSCSTKGEAGVKALVFPAQNDQDVPLARAMVPALSLGLSLRPAMPACSRGSIATVEGEFLLGGENGDALPRIAMRADGKPGTVVYLAKPEGQRTYALALIHGGGIVAAHRFYDGLPDDATLLQDIKAALTEKGYLVATRRSTMSGGAQIQEVSFGFKPAGGYPLAPAPTLKPGETAIVGPQITVSVPDMKPFVDIGDGLHHRASGFGCPQILEGGAVLLMNLSPSANEMICSYRQGPDLKLNPAAPIRYQLSFTRSDVSAKALVDILSESAAKAFRIKAVKAAPAVAGKPSPAEWSAFWDIEGGTVEGMWVSKSGDWLVRLRASYPALAANDAEAARVAATLFEQVKTAPRAP